MLARPTYMTNDSSDDANQITRSGGAASNPTLSKIITKICCGRIYAITAGSGILSFISAGIASYGGASPTVYGSLAAVGGALILGSLGCGFCGVLGNVPATVEDLPL